jgi:hypothetical protein
MFGTCVDNTEFAHRVHTLRGWRCNTIRSYMKGQKMREGEEYQIKKMKGTRK